METISTTSTNLPPLLHHELLLAGVKIHAELKRNNFITLGSNPFPWGFIIRFSFCGYEGTLRLFKNLKNKTSIDYSGIYERWLIRKIKKIIESLSLFSGPVRHIIPSREKRWKAWVYREIVLSKD